jgi:hypothetical protein
MQVNAAVQTLSLTRRMMILQFFESCNMQMCTDILKVPAAFTFYPEDARQQVSQ